METWLYFILGIVFYAWVVPIFKSLTLMITTFFNAITAKIQISIVKSNEKCLDIQGTETNTNVIGFQSFSVDDYDDYEDDEDDDE